jgi:hypothetical protein
MSFTWGSVFSIVEQLCGLNDERLGEYLGYNKSTIWRHITGKRTSVRYGVKELYQKLFDPTNSESPVYKEYNDKEERLLPDLKYTIKETKFEEIIKTIESKEGINDVKFKGYKNSDYKKFVMEMLKIAKDNEPPPKPSSNKKNPMPIKMVKDFKEAFHRRGIESILKLDVKQLHIHFDSKLLDGASPFIEYIEIYVIKPHNEEMKPTPIHEFIEKMKKYIEALKEMPPPPSQLTREYGLLNNVKHRGRGGRLDYVPLNKFTPEETEIKNLQERLNELYERICGEKP